jgi:hypothetical protein
MAMRHSLTRDDLKALMAEREAVDAIALMGKFTRALAQSVIQALLRVGHREADGHSLAFIVPL